LMLQQDKPDDFVIATGVTTTVRDLMKTAFEEAGIEVEFTDDGVNEKGVVKSCKNKEYQLETGKEIIAVDPNYFRPTEVDMLIGDASKAKEKLGWEPKYDLSALIKEMVQSDIELFKKDKFLKDGGHKVMNYNE